MTTLRKGTITRRDMVDEPCCAQCYTRLQPGDKVYYNADGDMFCQQSCYTDWRTELPRYGGDNEQDEYTVREYRATYARG